MKDWTLFSRLVVFALVVFTLASCGEDEEPIMEDPNIVEFATDNGSFTLLVAALEKTDLDMTLSNENTDYTVFAPTDVAFQDFLDNTIQTGSIENTPVDALSDVLLNHVLTGTNNSGDLSNGYVASFSKANFDDALNIPLYINVDNGVLVNGGSTASNFGADVTGADNATSNGVIHVVDQVISPAVLPVFIIADPELSTLFAALTRDDLTTDYVAAVSDANAFYTIFAPTNAAWEDYLGDEGFNSLSEVPLTSLEFRLNVHVVTDGAIPSGSLAEGDNTAMTLSAGNDLTVNLSNGAVTVITPATTANVVEADIYATNGPIHKIDRVLSPN